MARILLLATALVVLGACAPTFASALHSPPPRLSRVDAEQLMLRADDLRRQAFEVPGRAALSETFGGSALTRLLAQSEGFRLRGLRMDERDPTRSLVYWNSVSLEGVLQVAAERRMVSLDQPAQRWTATLRQWWVRLRNVGGRWFVVDEGDLSPDQWHQVTPSA